LVAPAGAAGLQDFLREVEPFVFGGVLEIVQYPGVFQGEKASQSLSEALRKVARDHIREKFDVVVVIRGGGAVADLAWLNDEKIAFAFAELPAPAVTGLGHEKDDTILDEMACVRAGTPSKAAAFVVGRILAANLGALEDIASIARRAEEMLGLAENACRNAVRDVEEGSGRTLDAAERETARHANEIQTAAVSMLTAAHEKTTATIERAPEIAAALLATARTRTLEIMAATADGADGIARQAGAVAMRLVEDAFPNAAARLAAAEREISESKKSCLSMGIGGVLDRGFALVSEIDGTSGENAERRAGRPVSTAAAAASKREISIRFRDGTVEATLQRRI
ncbi:MAG: hypothetical protein ING19_20110, partial [Azospirillum sp.]|nr:hypothetical protein [Azospirillum sp.]